MKVDVEIDDTYNHRGIYMIKMIAGSAGMKFESSGDHEDGLDSVRALSGWWVYEKKEWEDL